MMAGGCQNMYRELINCICMHTLCVNVRVKKEKYNITAWNEQYKY